MLKYSRYRKEIHKMNKIIENMMQRRSVRSFKDEQINREQLEEILLAGMWAPTGRNMQSPKIVVVQDKETIALLSKLNGEIAERENDQFYGAPTVLVVFADSNVHTYVEDGSLVLGNIMNAAFSLGVDSCWIHRARQTFETPEGKALKAKWGIEDSYVGIGNCILGYRNGELPTARPRKEDWIIFD